MAEHAIPGYIKSHVHPDSIDLNAGEMLLLPTFRLPTVDSHAVGERQVVVLKYPIATRSGSIRKTPRIWTSRPVICSRSTPEIGYFIDKVWVTEGGIKPGVVACSHHIGRWRLAEDQGGERWSTALVDLKQMGAGKWMMRHVHGIMPFKSDDPDSERIFGKTVASIRI